MKTKIRFNQATALGMLVAISSLSGTSDAQELKVHGRGEFLLGSNPLRFSSAWSGYADSAANRAEISNDSDAFKTLMIVGNKSAGLGRRVSVWDRLEVNGALFTKGFTTFSRDGTSECCSGGDYTLALAENTGISGKRAALQFHNGHEAEGRMTLVGADRSGGLSGSRSLPEHRFLFGSTTSPIGGEFTGTLSVQSLRFADGSVQRTANQGGGGTSQWTGNSSAITFGSVGVTANGAINAVNMQASNGFFTYGNAGYFLKPAADSKLKKVAADELCLGTQCITSWSSGNPGSGTGNFWSGNSTAISYGSVGATANGALNAVNMQTSNGFYTVGNPNYYLKPAETSFLNRVEVQSFINHSSRESKGNIHYVREEELNGMLKQVEGMKLARFQYKKRGAGQRGLDDTVHLGFIAEEMPSDLTLNKGVKVYDLLSTAIGAIKAQQSQIATQAERIKLQDERFKSQALELEELRRELRSLKRVR